MADLIPAESELIDGKLVTKAGKLSWRELAAMPTQ
jgi:hypothetical protein